MPYMRPQLRASGEFPICEANSLAAARVRPFATLPPRRARLRTALVAILYSGDFETVIDAWERLESILGLGVTRAHFRARYGIRLIQCSYCAGRYGWRTQAAVYSDSLCPACREAREEEEDENENEDRDLYAAEFDPLKKLPFMPGTLGRAQYPSAPYMGIELETQSLSTGIGEMVSAIESRLRPQSGAQFAICKEDGSLGDDGIEIVTAPALYSVHAHVWPRFLANNWAHNNGLEAFAHHSTGMHVHLNARSITPMVGVKMEAFINSAQNAGFVQLIAERQFNNYCARRGFNSLPCYNRAPETRYLAVNRVKVITGTRTTPRGLQLRGAIVAGTFEFRFFKANLKPERILKNLEFLLALRAFATASVYRDMNPETFSRHVLANRNLYANLDKFMASRCTSAAVGVQHPKKPKVPSLITIAAAKIMKRTRAAEQRARRI